MALIILEGLDRTGKSSVAKHFEAQGYELIHQSAPPKEQSADNFLEEQIALVSSAASKDVVLDRSYYGELVWPQVYKRDSLLTADGIEALRELEQSVSTTRILMHDPNVEAHWRRCVQNKEPMNKVQFVQARQLFFDLAVQYGFERKTLQDYPDLLDAKPVAKPANANPELPVVQGARAGDVPRTTEQDRLARANAINGVLSKRLLKAKGPIYDQLENDLRSYLNAELGKIFGTKAAPAGQFDSEEVELLKFFCNKLKEGKK